MEASKTLLAKAKENGHLETRIEKRYECFIELKDDDNKKYPKIVTAYCTLGSTVAKYIKFFISKIDQADIMESWEEGKDYPTVLVIGPRQYLKKVYDELIKDYPQIQYKQYIESALSTIDAYEILLKEVSHNLGWRLLINFYLAVDDIKNIIIESTNGKNIIDCLTQNLLKNIKK